MLFKFEFYMKIIFDLQFFQPYHSMDRLQRNFTNFNDFFSLHWNISNLIGLRFNINDKNIEKMWYKLEEFLVFSFFQVLQVLHFLSTSCLFAAPEISTELKLSFVPRVLVVAELIFSRIFYYHHARRIARIIQKLKEYFDEDSMSSSYLIKNARIVHYYVAFFLGTAGVDFLISFLITLFLFFQSGTWTPLPHSEFWMPFEIEKYFLLVVVIYAISFGSILLTVMATEPTISMIMCHINHQFKNIAVDLAEWNGDGNDIKRIIQKQNELYEFNFIFQCSIIQIIIIVSLQNMQ